MYSPCVKMRVNRLVIGIVRLVTSPFPQFLAQWFSHLKSKLKDIKKPSRSLPFFFTKKKKCYYALAKMIIDIISDYISWRLYLESPKRSRVKSNIDMKYNLK